MGKRVLVVGAGAAGLMAAWSAAARGASVTILEKMPYPGLKLLLTGSGRCNITNSSDMDIFVQKYFGQGRFLYPAFNNFFRDDLLALMTSQGLHFITEENGKIFPAGGKAQEVLSALIKLTEKYNVRLLTGIAAKEIIINQERAAGVNTDSGIYSADAVILAAGGSSWPGTGSSGDSYKLAAAAGHMITATRPALVPVVIANEWVHDLQGISLPQVEVQLIRNGRKKMTETGELLFTHFGLSGPAILRISRNIPDFSQTSGLHTDDNWQLKIDLLPQMKQHELITLWRKAITDNPARLLLNCLREPLPTRLTSALIRQHDIDKDQKAAATSIQFLESLASECKGLLLNIKDTRGYREAMVTAGGVSLRETDPRSMMSRRLPGLYIAGEALDIDGDTGGYNLQAAFSTGVLAGQHAASD